MCEVIVLFDPRVLRIGLSLFLIPMYFMEGLNYNVNSMVSFWNLYTIVITCVKVQVYL
jgi:hypothetical protein